MDSVMLQVYRRGRRFRLCLGIRGPSDDHIDRACSMRSDSMDVNESAKRYLCICQSGMNVRNNTRGRVLLTFGLAVDVSQRGSDKCVPACITVSPRS
jgi:hypothetical protein